MLLDLEKKGIMTSTTSQIWYNPENPAQKKCWKLPFLARKNAPWMSHHHATELETWNICGPTIPPSLVAFLPAIGVVKFRSCQDVWKWPISSSFVSFLYTLELLGHFSAGDLELGFSHLSPLDLRHRLWHTATDKCRPMLFPLDTCRRHEVTGYLSSGHDY